MPKSRGRKPKKKRAPASAPKKRLDNLNATPQELPLSAATPRATAVGDGATPRAAHTKNKTDREAYNGCCPCGHRHSAVCLCVYIDETMKGDSVVRVNRSSIEVVHLPFHGGYRCLCSVTAAHSVRRGMARPRPFRWLSQFRNSFLLSGIGLVRQAWIGARSPVTR